MTHSISYLSNKFESLDWDECKYVQCDKSFTIEDPETSCCLCNNNLITSNRKNHVLIGSYAPDVISRVHYLCYNCKKHCNICC